MRLLIGIYATFALSFFVAVVPAFFHGSYGSGSAVAQPAPPDPFVAAVNEKSADAGRTLGVFSDQLLRGHGLELQQAAQIAELTKENADLKAKLGQAPAAPPAEKK